MLSFLLVKVLFLPFVKQKREHIDINKKAAVTGIPETQRASSPISAGAHLRAHIELPQPGSGFSCYRLTRVGLSFLTFYYFELILDWQNCKDRTSRSHTPFTQLPLTWTSCLTTGHLPKLRPSHGHGAAVQTPGFSQVSPIFPLTSLLCPTSQSRNQHYI